MSYEVLLLLSRADAGVEAVPVPKKVPLEHTRDWPGAPEALAQARAAVRIIDELPSEERLPAFVARVAEAVAKLPCVAIWWKPAERVVDPRALAAAVDDPLRVAVNVRLFHVEEGADDERVMDTVGLAALGLADVQCHFVALDPAAVAAVLDETAHYLYDEGDDVIADGDTVAGVDGARWECRRELALVDPPRDVIDLSPPAPYRAPRA